MNIDEIKLLVDELIISRKQVEINRNEWALQTKPALEAAFHYLKSNFPPTIEFNHYADIFAQNLEAVVFSLGSGDSGISLEVEETTVSYIKHYGHLVFGQLHNGEISVVISLPYIEELVTNDEQEIIFPPLRPSELTHSKILEVFHAFLTKILEWENNPLSAGFRHGLYG